MSNPTWDNLQNAMDDIGTKATLPDTEPARFLFAVEWDGVAEVHLDLGDGEARWGHVQVNEDTTVGNVLEMLRALNLDGLADYIAEEAEVPLDAPLASFAQ